MDSLKTVLLGLVSLWLMTAQANTIYWPVVKIADDDTIAILMAPNTEQRVRLAGIDAPQSHQALGSKSKSKSERRQAPNQTEKGA